MQRYETKSGTRFRAIAFRDGKQKACGSHGTEEEALEALSRFYETPASPKVETYIERPCLALWAVEWARRRDEDGRHRDMKSVWLGVDRLIVPHAMAQVPLARLTRKHIKGFMRDQLNCRTKRGTRPRRQTVVNTMNLLRVILRDAVEEELMEVNPAAGVVVPKETRTDQKWTVLTLDEVRRVLAAKCLSEQNRNLLQFAFFTGCRAGEMFGLRKADVDLAARIATIRFSYDGPVKNGEAQVIPLLQPALDALARQMAASNPYEYVFPGRGGRCRHNGANAQFKDALREVGITRRVRLHDARHTFASFLVSGALGAEFTLYQTSALLRHKSSSMTARYAHMMPDNVNSKVHATAFAL